MARLSAGAFAAILSQQTIDRLNVVYGDTAVDQASAGTESLLVALLTLRFSRAGYLFREKLANGGGQAVADNLEGVAVFV